MFRFSDMYSLGRLYGSLVECGGRIETMTHIFNLKSFCWYVKVFPDLDEVSTSLCIRVPPWVKAFSFKNCICFLERTSWTEPESNGYDDLLVHECSHCLAKARYGTTLPRWFDEGLAMYFAGQIGNTFGTELPSEEILLTEMGYDEPMLYSYSALIMDSLIKRFDISEILGFADDIRNFRPNGVLGENSLRELIRYFKEK